MIIHRDLMQNTPEWDEIRKEKLTASHATEIGNQGKGLETYIKSIVRNMFIDTKSYINKDMERGNKLQPIATIKYEFENNCTIEQVGFIEINKYLGFSPDGLLNDDGGVEIKCRNDEKHFDLILTGKLESSTIWQVQMSLLLSKRKYWDVLNYNPNFRKSLVVHRIVPDEEKFAKLEAGIKKGEEMLKKLLLNKNVKFELKN